MSSSKRKRSNEQRLKAVEEKRAKLKARSLSINVSRNTGSGQHVVFSSDGEDSSADDGIEHAQRLKLFGSSGSESEDSELNNLETKFKGDRGEELFRLQHRIGHDKRFKVDERFLSGEEEREEREKREEKSEGDVEDELSLQIQQEKANALKIINSLFGGGALQQPCNGVRSQVSMTRNIPVLPMRYDPNTEASAQLELGRKTYNHDQRETSSSDEQEGVVLTDDKRLSPQEPPPVSSDRYYNIKEDIKDLFCSSQQQFNFLADVEGEPDGETVTNELPAEPTTSITGPTWLRAVSKLSSSKSEQKKSEIVSGIDNLEEKNATVAGERTLLFFHSCSPSLCNRLDENQFYRTDPLSELEASWPLRRNVMKQSFRKRRKDAVKFARKKRKHVN